MMMSYTFMFKVYQQKSKTKLKLSLFGNLFRSTVITCSVFFAYTEGV